MTHHEKLRKLIEFGVKCRLFCGHPIFMTHYGKAEFENKVLARCYGAKDYVPAEWIEVDPEVLDLIEASHDDWRRIVERYPELVREVYEELKEEYPNAPCLLEFKRRD